MADNYSALVALTVAALVVAAGACSSVGEDGFQDAKGLEPKKMMDLPFQARTLLQFAAAQPRTGFATPQTGFSRPQTGQTGYNPTGQTGYGRPQTGFNAATGGYTQPQRPVQTAAGGYAQAQRSAQTAAGSYTQATTGFNAATGGFSAAQSGVPGATGAFGGTAGAGFNAATGARGFSQPRPSAAGFGAQGGAPRSTRKPALIDRVQQRVRAWEPNTVVGETMQSIVQGVADAVVDFADGF